MSAVHGPVAVVHFDAHLDTYDTYFGAAYTHGTPFRRAFEEGLLDRSGCLHAGIRGPLYTDTDLTEDSEMGFQVIPAADVEQIGVTGMVEQIAQCVADRPVYLSIDIDVLDPAHAPGTGTTSMPWRRQRLTKRCPGSEMAGVPASLTRAIFAPCSRSITSSAARVISLCW